jgi:hypothetical protein
LLKTLSRQTVTQICHSSLSSHKLQSEILFQQDGASLHFSHEVLNTQNFNIPNRWTGRYGPTPALPRNTALWRLDLLLGKENPEFKSPTRENEHTCSGSYSGNSSMKAAIYWAQFRCTQCWVHTWRTHKVCLKTMSL